jgi:uncharacterized membrane protein YbhN (UPF0104 family)
VKKKTLWWLKLGIALVLIGYLLHRVGLESLKDTLLKANAGWIVAGGITIMLGFVLNGLSLQVLMHRSRRGSVGSLDYYAAFFHSSFLSFWLPGRLGDFSIAYMLRHQIPMGDAFICTLLDKVITLVVMLAVALIGIEYFIDIPPRYWVILASLTATSVVLVAITRRWCLSILSRYLSKTVKHQLGPLWETFLYYLIHRRSALIINILVTCFRLLIVGLSLVFMLGAFSENLPLVDGVLAVGSVQVLSLFPISIQGLGVMEGAYMVLLSPQGISEAGILLLCFIGRFLSIIIVFVIHITFVLIDMVRYHPNEF